jgi:arylsulfatase A-like enzyme
MALTRRDFLRVAGAGAAGAAGIGAAGCSFGIGGNSSDKPNILLVIVDTLRADHVGTFGGPVHTPNIDELAAAGVRFTRVYPEAMVTVPARRSIYTGRRIFPFRDYDPKPDLGTSPGWEPITDVRHTLTSALNDAGYWTAQVTDNPWTGFTKSYRPWRLSFDRFISVEGYVGFRRPPSTISDRQLYHWLPRGLRTDRYLKGVRKFLANTGAGRDERQSCTARVFETAINVLNEAQTKRPFAMMVDCYEPHEPWVPERKYVEMYGDPDYHGPEPSVPKYARADYLRPEVLHRMKVVYAAAVTRMDHWLGMFLERFYELGLDENTIVLFLGDHGILLGERGWTGKIPPVLHPEMVHVPFFVNHPEGKRRGTDHLYYASTHDVAPTLLGMAGLTPPPWMEGADLSPVFEDGPLPERPRAYGGYYNRHYIRTPEWVYMADNQVKEQKLFDLVLDPEEAIDVADEHPDVLEEMNEWLLEQIGGRPAPYYT